MVIPGRVCAVVPAAGRGSRLGLDMPKILVPVDERTTVWEVLRQRLEPYVDHIHVVMSPSGAADFAAALARDPRPGFASVSVQLEPTGMGDAIFGCYEQWAGYDTILIVWGDQVHVSAATVDAVLKLQGNEAGTPGFDARCTIPLVRQPEPYVEYRFAADGGLDAVLQSREGDRCEPHGLADVGVFCLSTGGLMAAWREYLSQLPQGQLASSADITGEINFLPFLPYLSRIAKWTFCAVTVTDPVEAQGINTPQDLAFARERWLSQPKLMPGHLYFVCTEVPPYVVGGLGRYVERLTREFADGGVRADIFGLGQSSSEQPVAAASAQRERRGSLTMHRLVPISSVWPRRLRPSARSSRMLRLRLAVRNVSFNARVTYRILAADRRRRGSVVAVHDWMGCLAGIACRVFAGIPVVFHVHSNEMTVGTSWRSRPFVVTGIAILEGVQARLAARIIVPSTTMRELLILRGWSAAKIQVIGHGFEDPALEQLSAGFNQGTVELTAVRERYLRDPTDQLIVYAGRLSPMKGVLTLLEAVALLRDQGTDCMLVLCGNETPHSGENNQVMADIKRWGLADRVIPLFRLLPSTELYRHFLTADVCVFPSHYEPFGLVAVEAMALARPVVLGPGFCRELADDSDDVALRCRDDSAAELARVVRRALTDREWAATVGPRARAHVTREFRWQRAAEATVRCYAEAATPRRGWRQLLADYRFAIGPAALSTVASGLSAAATLVIARGIGAVQFGGYTVVLTAGGILMIAALFSMNVVMYQELPRRPTEQHSAMLSTGLAVGLTLGSAVALVVALCAPIVEAAFNINAATLRYSVAFGLTTGFSMLAESFLRGRKRYLWVSSLKLALAMCYLSVSMFSLLVLKVPDFGFYIMLLSVSNVVFGVVALLGQPIRLGEVSAPLARQILRHGGYISVTAALLVVISGLDIIFMNHQYPQDVVGAYSIYNGFPKRLLGIVFTEGIGLVLLPTLATLAKPELLQRIGRAAPFLGAAAAALSFAASTVLLSFLGDGYQYSLPFMALAALGIGTHTVFNMYYFALSMDSTRGAKVIILCLLITLPVAALVQWLLIHGFGLGGGLVGFAVTNALLIGVILAVNTRVYPIEGSSSVREAESQWATR
jgi:glycosyltransferase involved in cell wall biosynthesis/CTP:molybdopterin cytidylyltransferase MocA/O-antigen/teichoic acid export membrane protein